MTELTPDRRRVLGRAIAQRLGVDAINALENQARAAARRGDQKGLGDILIRLEAMTPVGGRNDRFKALCDEIEAMHGAEPEPAPADLNQFMAIEGWLTMK